MQKVLKLYFKIKLIIRLFKDKDIENCNDLIGKLLMMEEENYYYLQLMKEKTKNIEDKKEK